MITAVNDTPTTKIKTLFESCRRQGIPLQHGYLPVLREILGIRKRVEGNSVQTYLDPAARKMVPESFSFKGVAQAILGPDAEEKFNPQNIHESVALMEDGVTAVQPTAFADISAFNATVGLLIEVKILEGYQRPEFGYPMYARTVPTRQRSQKLIAASMIGDFAKNFGPGDPHPRGTFTERYVTTPLTQKRGAAIEVTKEAVFFDLTTEVLERANQVGTALGIRRERLTLDVMWGNTNPYIYNGTSYNTYNTSGNWINTQGSVTITDWTSFRTAWVLMTQMTDQETGLPIFVQPKDLLCSPYRLPDVQRILAATAYAQVDNSSSNATAQRTYSPREAVEFLKLINNVFGIEQATWSYFHLTAADGFNKTSAQAQEYVLIGDFMKAFAYMQNWEMVVQRADPNTASYVDQMVVLGVFANEMGIPTVQEPRQVTKLTNT